MLQDVKTYKFICIYHKNVFTLPIEKIRDLSISLAKTRKVQFIDVTMNEINQAINMESQFETSKISDSVKKNLDRPVSFLCYILFS